MSYSPEFIFYCNTLGLKLTSLRKAVLYLLWHENKPLKAYDLLTKLLPIKSNATPPTVYRALDFFVEAGIVHKIESIQSYTLCCEPEKQFSSEVLMVCHACHHVVEVYENDMRALMAKLSQQYDFQFSEDVVEMKGTCSRCANKNQNTLEVIRHACHPENAAV